MIVHLWSYPKNLKTKKMNANMKVSEQCRIAATNGNQVLGMIDNYKSLIVPLYKAIVRHH